MNDQIAKTLNQPAFDRLKDWYDIGPVQKATLELFAELIVRECAGIYSKIDNGNSHMGTDNYLDALHKTFWS
jgi:hypothetical protein